MADPREMNRKISSFYDNYHRGRNRQPEEWMQKNYWPAFVGRTLDVGGGTLHPERKEYALVDLSTEAVRRALDNSIPAVIANGSYLPFASRAYDTVACYDVLEHVIEPKFFIAELCRVANQRVVVAGPNFIAGAQGNLDRRLLGWLWQFLTNHDSRLTPLENPHITFDENWAPDRDAVTAANAAWVADQMKKQGYRIHTLRTWEVNYHWLNTFPFVRALGPIMLVVGSRL